MNNTQHPFIKSLPLPQCSFCSHGPQNPAPPTPRFRSMPTGNSRSPIPPTLKTEFDHSHWQPIELPHDWSIQGPIAQKNPTGSPGGFFPAGVGWYWKSFTAPADWTGQHVTIRFDGVYMLSDVWINGEKLGTHAYGYTPFTYDLTPHLKTGQENTIAVRVDNAQQKNSRWYSGSGIYRHVWLDIRQPLHLQSDGICIRTLSADKDTAKLKIAITAENDSGAQPPSLASTTDIFALDAAGHPVGNALAHADPIKGFFETKNGSPEKTSTVETELTLPNPHLWSAEHPAQYAAVTILTQDGRTLDQIETPFGIRTITVSADKGFLLNGQRVLLYGGCVHHDNGPLGAAAFDRAEERRVQLLKDAGFNAIRTSHNPPSHAFLNACDRLGMLVLDEAFDCWEQGKNAQDYHRYFNHDWKQDIDAMVLRDRNHPSVVMWSIGNEIPDFGSAQGLRDGSLLIVRIKELDPTRPVTDAVNWWPHMGGKNDWQWNDADALMSKLDVVGYNYQISRYAQDHQRMPQRVIASTESYPRDFFACWAAAADNPWIIGDFVWTAMDYLGESGIGRVWNPDEKILFHAESGQYPYHGAYCGDIDLTGFRKPISHARNITWDRGEKLYTSITEPAPDGRPLRVADWGTIPSAASWTWPGYENKPLIVTVYSRYDRVRLYLNNTLIEEKPTTRAEQFQAIFHVPYTPGSLKTVGIQNGKEVATNALTTAGPATALRLTPDRTTLAADGQDLTFITVESIDAAGNLQPTGNQLVHFTLTGPATLAGVTNADFSGTDSYQQNQRPLFQGRALIILRTTHQPGTVEVQATADALTEATQAA